MISETILQDTINSSLNKLFHEIKNPLSICSGYVEIMQKKDNTKYLAIINTELKRIEEILKEYQNNNTLKRKININKMFYDIKEILDSLYKDNNTYILIECNSNLELYGNYNQLKQLFINIFKNSQEAKDKNILIIKVKVIKLKKYIKITISDNGKGMNKNELEKMSEEYYTTKENGTGLGVPLIFDIVKNHHGIINYKSCETKGTTITIKFPIEN